MSKQTYQIPEGCKAITMEIIDNKIITTFEPNEFKSGDILISCKNIVSIYRKVDGVHAYYYFSHDIDRIISDNFSNLCYNGCIADSRHATPEEAQLLWDALAKKGKRWNPETMQVEELKKKRWRAKVGEKYYYISGILCTEYGYEEEHYVDDIRHKKGNYFQTEEQAQRAADRLKAELDKFWEEELK